MTYIGTVHNGAIILPPKAHLPEGSKVEVRPMPVESEEAVTGMVGLTEELVQLSREISGLPSDLARNHDHYLHGHPRMT